MITAGVLMAFILGSMVKWQVYKNGCYFWLERAVLFNQ